MTREPILREEDFPEEFVGFVNAVISRERHRGRRGTKHCARVARARLRIFMGVAGEEDLRIAKEFEGVTLPYQWSITS